MLRPPSFMLQGAAHHRVMLRLLHAAYAIAAAVGLVAVLLLVQHPARHFMANVFVFAIDSSSRSSAASSPSSSGSTCLALLADDSPAAVQRVRAATSVCHPSARSPYDSLVLHRPLKACNASELYAALATSWRDEEDGPLHVRGCALRWFAAADACQTLQAAGFVFLRGDSLVRHLLQALLTILVGDYSATTSALSNHSDPAYHSCDCDEAYDDGHRKLHNGSKNDFCRFSTVAYVVHRKFPSARNIFPSLCPMWQRWHLGINFGGSLSERAIMYASGGLHSRTLNGSAVETYFGNAARESVLGHSPYHHFVCGLLHAPGSNKAIQYRSTHGLGPTVQYNALIAARCTRPGDSVFDAFHATLNASSIDGQHFFQRTNILLGQLYLNHVDAVVRGRAHSDSQF